MNKSQTTFSWFVQDGTLYGGCLGALAGSFVLPLLGSLLGAFIGGIGGLGLGVVLGVCIALLNRLMFDADIEIQRYRRWLTLGTGIFVTVVSAPFIAIFAPIAGVAAAYSASHYADWYGKSWVKRKNDRNDNDRNDQIETADSAPASSMLSTIKIFNRAAFQRGWWSIPLAALFGVALWYGGLPSWYMLAYQWVILVEFLAIAAVSLVASGLIFMLIVSSNALVFHAFNRLILHEYWPNLPQARYKQAAGVMAFLFTMLSSGIVTLGLGLVPAAFIMAMAARTFADEYYDEKDKSGNGKAKRTLEDLEASIMQRLATAPSPMTVGEDGELIFNDEFENRLLQKSKEDLS